VARVLLILPTATYRAPEFLAAARHLGVDVATASEKPQALAHLMVDRFVHVTLDDPLAAAATIVDFAERVPLDAIVAVDDQGSLAAAHAAAHLGLIHNAPHAVATTRNKGEMRRQFASASVPQPRFQIVGEASPPAVGDVLQAANEIGYPVVIKPVGLSGSRGVIRADDDESASAAFNRIGLILDTLADQPRTLVVESFIGGPEVAIEGLLVAGAFRCLAIFDKPDPLDGPFFEETIYVTPSRHSASALRATTRAVGAAAAALGLCEGPIHAEARLTAGGPVVLELAARTIGGRCAAALHFATGVSLEEIVLRHALGLPLPELGDGARPSGVMMLPIAQSGRLVGVSGKRAAIATPGVTSLEIVVPSGQRVESLPEGSRYLGFLFAEGPTPAAVEEALRAGHAQLTIDIAGDRSATTPERKSGAGTSDRSVAAAR
jgi:biotin carboxylase